MSAPRNKATFILPSYARPQNMRRIIELVKKSNSCAHIILNNNQPNIDIHDFIDQPDNDMTVLQQDQDYGHIKRYLIAREADADFFISIDDDIFLTSDQIDALVGKLIEAPSRVHGVRGEIVQFENNVYRTHPFNYNRECEVSILNCVYGFTKHHVLRFFQLIDSLGFTDPKQLGPADDIIISFTGNGAPLSHDLGPFEICPTARDETIATWKQEGFNEYRAGLWAGIQKLYLAGAPPFTQPLAFIGVENGTKRRN